MTTEKTDFAMGSYEEVGENHGGNVKTTDLLSELSTIQEAFSWHLTKQRRIRACLKNDAAQRLFDPITAVVYFKTGEFFPEGNWTEAATTMGLVYSECAEVVAACNYDWDPSCRQGVLRHNLLNILVPDQAGDAARSGWILADTLLRGFRKRSESTTTH